MTLADMKKQVNQVFVGERLAEMQKLIDDRIAKVKDGYTPQKGKDYADGYTPVKGKDYFDGKDGTAITPQDIYSKLRFVGVEMSIVKGLEDEIKQLRKELATKSSGGARRVFQPYVDDFSAQTNGSLKVFVLSREPLRTNTVQVFGTDFPTILRPTTDFTVSGKTLTLTAAVPAPSVGATLVAHFFA